MTPISSLVKNLACEIRRRLGSRGIPLAVAGCAAIVNVSCLPSATEPPKTRLSPEAAAALAGPSGERPAATVASATESAAPELVRLQDLAVREESGQTAVQLRLSRPISQYRHFPLTVPARIVLDIFGDPDRPRDVETFRVDTSLVSTLRVSPGEGYIRFTFDIAGATVPPYVITPQDGGLRVVIGSTDPKLTARRELRLVRDGKRVDVQVSEAKPAPDGKPAPGVPEPGRAEGKKYTGQRLSLDFKDADIKNIFRLLAEVSGLNIIVTNDVNRRVTLRLVDVPWDQALDLLIDTNGLAKEQIGNVVRISTAAQLKAERDALVAAKRAEEVLEPLQTAYFNINYAKVKDLEPKVKMLLSKRPDASLVIDERSNTIMVRDVRKSVEDINGLLSRLDSRTPQVLIESNLIETTPTFARALGLRLQFSRGGTTFSTAAGAGTPFAGTTASFPNAPTGLGGTVSVIQDAVGGLRNLAGALEAAEQEGNIRIISRPSVVTLNNVASTIRSERILRIALPESTTNIASGTGASAGGAAVATERIPIGIILTVTPQVSSDGYVLLNINVKSSTIADSATVPGGQTGVIPFDELNREAVANVLVRDGETIVLGGILKDTRQNSQSGVPYLKDIPFLGWLFKNMRWQKDFEELMVFITPRITSAGSADLPSAEQLWREQMKKTVGDQPTVNLRSGG
ncbi:MAG TPA: type IV pilus secretin PilQ [Candidatus Eisenbacteria bacterium]|nr:type IV pilus secretin PilQ [Candidatus Eisenbacteria bacterium]